MHQNDTVGLPHKIKWITLCGLLMAINTIFSSFSVPVPGGHIYLNDIIIVIAALSLDPWAHFLSAVWARSSGISFSIPSPCSSPLPPTVSAPSSCPLSWAGMEETTSLSFLERPSLAPSSPSRDTLWARPTCTAPGNMPC